MGKLYRDENFMAYLLSTWYEKFSKNIVEVERCDMDLRLITLIFFSNVWCHVNEAKLEL